MIRVSRNQVGRGGAEHDVATIGGDVIDSARPVRLSTIAGDADPPRLRTRHITHKDILNPLVSCATRFVATELNATRLPSPDTTPQQLEPLPCAPADDKLTGTLDTTTPAAARIGPVNPAATTAATSTAKTNHCSPRIPNRPPQPGHHDSTYCSLLRFPTRKLPDIPVEAGRGERSASGGSGVGPEAQRRAAASGLASTPAPVQLCVAGPVTGRRHGPGHGRSGRTRRAQRSCVSR